MKRNITIKSFDSQDLIDELVKQATTGTRWFDTVSPGVREEFAYDKCTWIYRGLAPEDLSASCVVVSYPRPDGKVRVYNMDGGSFSWVPVSKLTRTRRVRRAEERDYEYSSIVMHDDRPESEDITMQIDWANLDKHDV